MNTLDEINEKIAKMTAAIQENYPDLATYLKDMPEENDVEKRTAYYDSLLAKFREYVTDHQLQNANRKYKDHHL